MSTDIRARVMRAGVEQYSPVAMQLDLMSQQESAYYGGAAPYFRYEGYILGTYTLLQGDLLVDLDNTDPKTKQNAQYRIISDPEKFPDFHIELVCDRSIGR